MDNLIYEIFSGLSRQGPGSSFSTLKAAKLLNDVPTEPFILDLGCGTGAQTLLLAAHFGGKIIAVDNHAPYLEVLERNAHLQGLEEIIQVKQEDMFDLSFNNNTFDLVWAEGSAYILGFEQALLKMKRFLKPGGYFAVTELSWLKKQIPSDLEAFWEMEYPAMVDIETNIAFARNSGYELIDYFVLPPTAWWDDFYIPLEKRLKILRKKFAEEEEEEEEALELIEFTQLEIEMYRKYPEFYSSVFYILKKIS